MDGAVGRLANSHDKKSQTNCNRIVKNRGGKRQYVILPLSPIWVYFKPQQGH